MTRIVPERPTEAMLEAGMDNVVGCCSPDKREAADIYTAMIQAAPVVDVRREVIEELKDLALGSEDDNYKHYDGHVAEWLASVLEEE